MGPFGFQLFNFGFQLLKKCPMRDQTMGKALGSNNLMVAFFTCDPPLSWRVEIWGPTSGTSQFLCTKGRKM